MDLTAIAEGATAILGAITALASAVGAWRLIGRKLLPWWRTKLATRDIIANSIAHNRIQAQLQEWRAETGAMRTLCLVARNCGSHWDVDKSVTVTVIGESNGHHVPRVFSRWQEWKCDGPYREMLSDVVVAGQKERGVVITTDEMRDQELRDYYRAQGVAASFVFSIQITQDGAMVYISLNWGRPLNKAERESLTAIAAPEMEMTLTEEDRRAAGLSGEAKQRAVESALELAGDRERVRTMRRTGHDIWHGR